jgi:hypothetical protein
MSRRTTKRSISIVWVLAISMASSSRPRPRGTARRPRIIRQIADARADASDLLEFGHTGALNGSADMTFRLRQQVMTKLAEGGGKLPESLLT